MRPWIAATILCAACSSDATAPAAPIRTPAHPESLIGDWQYSVVETKAPPCNVDLCVFDPPDYHIEHRIHANLHISGPVDTVSVQDQADLTIYDIRLNLSGIGIDSVHGAGTGYSGRYLVDTTTLASKAGVSIAYRNGSTTPEMRAIIGVIINGNYAEFSADVNASTSFDGATSARGTFTRR